MSQVTRKFKTPRSATFISTVLAAVLMSACSSSNDDNDETGLDTNNSDDINTSMPSETFDLVPEQRAVASVGTLYTDQDGNSLYTRFNDTPNTVTCTADCAQQWPPLTTTVTTQGISGNFDVITRDDGSSQWTLLGFPLHRFQGDAAAGDVNGNGVDNEWALARPIPITSADIDGDEALVALGSTLADSTGEVRLEQDNYTLYVFANDSAGVSNCNGGCATTWPPLYADTGAVADGDRYTLITREDGAQQWAYDGAALYYWQGDSAPGEFGGDQIPNWSIARP